jgi:hypothetical protein
MNVFNLFEDSYERREVFKARVEKVGDEKDLNGDDQKEVLIGFDIARQQKNIEDDIRKVERKIEMLKRVVSIGVTKLEDFEAK